MNEKEGTKISLPFENGNGIKIQREDESKFNESRDFKMHKRVWRKQLIWSCNGAIMAVMIIDHVLSSNRFRHWKTYTKPMRFYYVNR